MNIKLPIYVVTRTTNKLNTVSDALVFIDSKDAYEARDLLVKKYVDFHKEEIASSGSVGLNAWVDRKDGEVITWIISKSNNDISLNVF